MSAEQSKEPVNNSIIPSVPLDDMPPSASEPTINTTTNENVTVDDTITNNNNIATLPPMPTMAPPPTPTTSLNNIIPSLSSADLSLLDNTGGTTNTAVTDSSVQEKAEQAPLTQEGIPNDNNKPAAKIEEESSSITTEESQSSSSSGDDEDSSSSESSSEESSEESSSDSSEDPSIDKSDKILNTTNNNTNDNEQEKEEVPKHMRKSPPESQLSPRLSTTATKKDVLPPQNPFTISPPLGEISSNGIIGSPNSVQSSKSEELMEGVLTTSQVLYDNEVDYDEDLEIGGSGLNMEAQQGAAFYAAYTDRKNYTDSLHYNNVRHSSTNGRGRRQSRRNSKIGQDRASIKSMVSHRFIGKGYDRSRRNKVAMRSNDRFILSGRKKSRRAGASRIHQYNERRDNNGGRTDERRTGWSNPNKKRRLIYACLACIVGIIGISLIVVGVLKEKEYNDNKVDEEYMDNNDFFELDGKEVPTTTTNANGGQEGGGGTTFDIENGISMVQPGQAPSGASNTDVVRPTTIVLQPKDTTTPQEGEDDALLILLKKAYYNALNNISDSYSYIDNAQNVQLDTSTQTKILQPKDQSAQYKAYLHLLNERTDVYDKSTNQIIMNTDRILQIYALVTFYFTFGWPMEGINECLWSGVTCSGLGVHDNEKHDTDGVPGSAMNEDGIISTEESTYHVVSFNVKGPDGTKEGSSQYGPILQGSTLPIELMFLRHLEVLDVSHNMIEGSLYGGMMHWKNIKVLALNDNRFTGTIPSDLGYLFNLQKLTLHHNEFDGVVPEELCELRDEGTLHFLWVDCSPMQSTNIPKVSCPIDDCCSICFEGYDKSGSSLLTSSGLDANKQETSHSVQQDDSSDLKNMLRYASSDEGMALMDINSPQFHAYAWLAGDVSSSQEATTYSNNDRMLQRYALAVLYFATNGVNWSLSDGWLTSEDECTWYGISGCQDANTAKIISIELKGNELVGTIPPELFEFIPTLVVLNLATNVLSGPIPKEIGMLSNINILELAENELTSIPSEMGNLNTIDHLFLQSNNFGEQSMPDEVCQLRTAGSLTLLWADCKGNTGSLQCSADCCTTCFESAMNGDNNVFEEDTGSSTTASDTVTYTPAITHADSDGDMLAKLKKMAPDGGVSLDDHVSPQYKAYSWLVSSSTSGFSSDILLLQRYGLATLYFSTAGHGWTKQEGWLSDNDVCQWEGVNDCIMMAGGSMVTELDLSSNNLVGRIPVELTHVRSLETLDLTDNELYGPIPPEFGYFEDMEVLRLGGNLLTGNIPPELAHLANLQELYLHVNDFSCTAMPEEICAMRTSLNLHTLWADCQASEFSAVYCDDVTCCTQCFGDESDFIPYGGYTTEGTYPPTITSPALAATIVPGRNYPPTFSPIGSSPLVENPELKTFLLSHMDGFDQRLADTSSHAYEAYMWLANNDGSLRQLNEMRKLQRFGLVTFLLSTTPEYDWKVSTNWKTQEHECNWFGISCAITDTVTELSLPSNRLSGTIPPEIALAGIGGKMSRLNLAGNNLGQELAKQVGFLSHLEELDLRSNDFTGKIPSELGELHLLKSLNLQANEFSGVMPSEICTLRSGQLDDLVADCDTTDPFSQVSCTLNSCCTECY